MRSLVALVVLLVGALLVPVATVGWWVRDTVVPTRAYVATVGPLAQDDAVVAAVEQRLTEQTMASITRAASDTLPAALRERVTKLVRFAVDKLVEDPAFGTAWRTANVVAHDEVVAVLSGETSSVRAGADSTVYVRLGSLGTEIRRELTAAGVPFTRSLPAFEADLPIGHTDDLVRARAGYDLLERYGRGLPVAALALIALGLLVSRRRLQALGWTAFVALGALGLLAVGMLVGRIYYVASLPSGISDAAGTAVFDTMTADLREDIITVAIGALVLLVLSAVLGRKTGRGAA
ncbi:hypothetical protein BH10ACT10_BH10ACT10_11360 [soil metagenome]